MIFVNVDVMAKNLLKLVLREIKRFTWRDYSDQDKECFHIAQVGAMQELSSTVLFLKINFLSTKNVTNTMKWNTKIPKVLPPTFKKLILNSENYHIAGTINPHFKYKKSN